MNFDNKMKDVIATILHHPELNIYADLYAKAFANELVEHISFHKDNIEKIGYILLRNWVYKKDLGQTILDLTGLPMETHLVECGVLPDTESCFILGTTITYKNAENELVEADIQVDPSTFEVNVKDPNILAEIKASVEGDYIPKLLFDKNLLPVFNHKQKQAFGVPVFWYYDAQYAITRPVNGITINSVEYCLDENCEVMLFPSMHKAKEYLAKLGYSEAMIEAEGIDIVEYTDHLVPFGNEILADKVNEIIKLTGEVLKITGDYSNGYTEDEYDILNGIEGLLTVYRNTIGAKEN